MTTSTLEQFVQQICDAPEVPLPENLPYPPLDILIELHSHIATFMHGHIALAEALAHVSRTLANRTPDDPLLDAQAHWSEGSAILYKPAYLQSLAHYDAALQAYERACLRSRPALPARDIRIVHIMRLGCLSELGRYDEAIQAATLAAAWVDQHPEHMHARLNLLISESHLLGRMGKYHAMASQAREIIALAEQYGHAHVLIKSLINLGYALIYLGELQEAEQALQSAATLAKYHSAFADLGRAHANRARLLQSRGELFAALKELNTARTYMQQAQAWEEKAYFDIEQSHLYLQIGHFEAALRAAIDAVQSYSQQAMYDYSFGAALDAIKIALRCGAPQKAQVLLSTFVQQPLSTTAAPLLAWHRLLAALTQALISRKKLPQRFREAAQTIQLLEELNLHHDAAEASLFLADIACQLGDATNANAQTRYTQLLTNTNPHIQIAALNGVARFTPAYQAVDLLQSASKLVIAQRRALPLEELQARYSSQKSQTILQLIDVLLELEQVEDAYTAVGEVKVGALLDLREATVNQTAGLHTDLEHLRWQIEHWRKTAGSYREQARHAALRDRAPLLAHAQEADQQATQHAQHLTQEITSLGLSERFGQANIPDADQLTASLPPDMLLIEYVLLDNDRLVAFIVCAQQQMRAVQLPSTGLAQLVMRWQVSRSGLSALVPGSHTAELQARMQPLWNLLIAPLLPLIHHATHLLIAPHGILHDIPWAMLYGDGSYLIDRFHLRLTPAGALWASPCDATSASVPRILCYAGSPDNPAAPVLQYAAQEIAAIRQVLPQAEVITSATRADLQQTQAPSILHLLVHGQTHPQVPLSSTLHFADGDLLLVEAHRLQLRGTQLAILSGCETGMRPAYGELVLAQVGAFLCAGARAVIASLWNVDDATTAELMTVFYQAYANGHDAASALRQAQLAVRQKHPLHWAAFQLWEGTSHETRV